MTFLFTNSFDKTQNMTILSTTITLWAQCYVTLVSFGRYLVRYSTKISVYLFVPFHDKNADITLKVSTFLLKVRYFGNTANSYGHNYR